MECEMIEYPDSNKILHALTLLKRVGVDQVRVSKSQYDQWSKAIDPRMKDAIQLHYIMGIEIVEHDA